MTLGSQIVAELARRQLLGSYFDFAGYHELRRVTCSEELARLLAKYGYNPTTLMESAEQVVDYLQAPEKRMCDAGHAFLTAEAFLELIWVILTACF